MIDFTKEELTDTLYALEQWCHPQCDYPRYIALREKIQSMIDSYSDGQQARDINSINPCPTCGDHHD
jgi:hypothetical protein